MAANPKMTVTGPLPIPEVKGAVTIDDGQPCGEQVIFEVKTDANFYVRFSDPEVFGLPGKDVDLLKGENPFTRTEPQSQEKNKTRYHVYPGIAPPSPITQIPSPRSMSKGQKQQFDGRWIPPKVA